MKKVLFVATVESHIVRFHLPYLKYFQDSGYEVHVACKCNSSIKYCDVLHNIPFEKMPHKIENIKVYKLFKNILKKNKFEIIHCHTPMGAAISRLAAIPYRKKGTKVIYTAHGFHFFKGAKIFNWLTYFVAEKLLGYFTDCLITINQEDFALAKKRIKAKQIFMIPGIGVDLERFGHVFSAEEVSCFKKNEDISDEDFVLIYVADLCKRKNQEFVINLSKDLKEKIPSLKVLLVGEDLLNGEYHNLVKGKKLESFVRLLGERYDIPQLLSISNLVVSSSRQEGLPMNIVEAMSAGKCVVASNARGNRDLITDGENGFLFELNSEKQFINRIIQLYLDRNLINEMGSKNILLSKNYTLDIVLDKLKSIYKLYES